MDWFTRPIFVVAPPQSGTSYLQAALALYPGVEALGAAARAAFDRAEELRPSARGHDSNRRTGEDAAPDSAERLRSELRRAIGSDGGGRFVDATPRNSLRVPFLDAVFPEASFVYLYREPREAVSGMAEAWSSGEYVTYPRLPGWQGPPWSLLLIPGWRQLAGRSVTQVATEQWIVTTRILLQDLEQLPPQRWCVADHAALASDPEPELERIADFLGLDGPLRGDLPRMEEHVLTPRSEAEASRADALQAALPRTIGLAENARDLIARPTSRRPTVTPDAESPLRSVYTGAFQALLADLETSLLATTGATGKVVVVRQDPPRLETHFRDLPRPTGVAAGAGWLAVATRAEVWRYRAAQPPAGDEFDGLFLPRDRLYTGEAGVRDLAAVSDEPWIVSSRFSCLASLDQEHTFVPRWRPRFVTATANEDRCHLTGLAVVDGEPGYVTALGVSDEPGGWREGKLGGGCVVDVASSELVATGLCLPHSPRWHDGRLWLLESGEGALCVLDPDRGDKEVVARLPGFARGLAFAGDVAFVGLSRLREGERPPVAERFSEHFSGIWAIRPETGAQRGFLRFGGDVDEVFAIAALPGMSTPEIADPSGERASKTFHLPLD